MFNAVPGWMGDCRFPLRDQDTQFQLISVQFPAIERTRTSHVKTPVLDRVSVIQPLDRVPVIQGVKSTIFPDIRSSAADHTEAEGFLACTWQRRHVAGLHGPGAPAREILRSSSSIIPTAHRFSACVSISGNTFLTGWGEPVEEAASQVPSPVHVLFNDARVCSLTCIPAALSIQLTLRRSLHQLA
jgi:hypothetical protein